MAAVVLGAAGAGKLARPTAAQPTLRALRLPASPLVVRVVGAAELVVALAVFAVGRAAAALALAAAYAALAAVAEVLRRQAASGVDASGCGCFGVSSAPVGWGHVVLNVLAAIAAFGAALDGLDAIGDIWPRLPAFGVAHAVLVATGASAMVAMLTVLPETRLAARRAPARDPRVHLFGPTIARKPSNAAPAAGGGPRKEGP